MMHELLIGCGSNKEKQLQIDKENKPWVNLVTLDINPDHKPDVLHDLNVFPYPFPDNDFDEIHAYEVLEHCGTQGDWRFFFKQWSEFYRILKPNGKFLGTVPDVKSSWVWGDPSHTRCIPSENLYFLSQRFYDQVGKTPASDFRNVWKGDFRIEGVQTLGDRMAFVLTAIKQENNNAN